MQSQTLTVQQIFQERRQYRVPFYQRAYVWNRGEQWERLWSDIRDKADARLDGDRLVPHFMGAVVLEPQRRVGLLGVECHHIIDGQQRLTTMQFVLTALGHALRDWGQVGLVPVVESCLNNGNPATMVNQTVEPFKVWPTFRDQQAHVLAMTAPTPEAFVELFPESFTKTRLLRLKGHRHPPSLEAILFFFGAMREWCRERLSAPGAPEPNAVAQALAEAIVTDLTMVCILLGEEDDAQVIFETLNGHGAQLHATDLIRNFIFMRAGANADALYTRIWQQFEDPYWHEKQARGRLFWPRLECLVQAAVEAETGEDIDIARLYAGYRRLVDTHESLHSADAQLTLLNKHARHYRDMITGADTAIGRFGACTRTWDATATHALALAVATSGLPLEDQNAIYGAIESFLVRRAICGLTIKNYNRVFAQVLAKVRRASLSVQLVLDALVEGSGDSSRWPNDEEFRREWLTGNAYNGGTRTPKGRLDAVKLRALFHRLETAMRRQGSDAPDLPPFVNVDIDHILPVSWYDHWPLADGTRVLPSEVSLAQIQGANAADAGARTRAILAREDAVTRLGNLTPVHLAANRAAQNREFAFKREAFDEYTDLRLNRRLMQSDHWDEAAIDQRGQALFDVALTLWPGPLVFK